MSDDTIKGLLQKVNDDDLVMLYRFVKNDNIYPALAAHILSGFTPEQFTHNLPRLQNLADLTITVEGRKNSHSRSIAESICDAATIVRQVCLTVPHEVLDSLHPVKLEALIQTVYSEVRDDPYGGMQPSLQYWWSDERINATLTEVLRHLNIVTDEDAQQVRQSEVGMIFRKLYLNRHLNLFANNDGSALGCQGVYSYPDELIDRMYELRKTNAVDHLKITSMFYEEQSVSTVNSALYLVPLAPEAEEKNTGAVLASLRHLTQKPQTHDYSQEPESVRSKSVALFIVLAIVLRNDYVSYSSTLTFDNEQKAWEFADHRITNLIMSNADRAHDIASCLLERLNVSYDTLTELLTNQTALSHGTL